MNEEKDKQKAASEVILEAVAVAKNVKDTADRVQHRLERNEHNILKALKETSDALKSHTAEDAINFKKQEELAKINGEHLSHFNKNLIEVKQMLIDQNRTYAQKEEEYLRYQKRTEPMILAYEIDQQFNKELGNRSSKWTSRIIKTGAVLGAATGIWASVKYLFKI